MKLNQIGIERGYVALLIFSAAGVSVFARSAMTWENLVMPALLAAVALTICIQYRVTVSMPILIVTGAHVASCLIQWIWYGSFHPKHLLIYPFNMWVAYVYVQSMGLRIFSHIEFIVTRLAAFGLIIWGMDLILASGIRNVLQGIYIGDPYNPIIDSYIIIYAFVNEGVESFFPRNSGFAWEPGSFAVFCCIAILINLYRRNFELRNNYGVMILAIALLSSQSTTGYGIFMVIIFGKLYRDLKGAARLLLPVSALFFAAVVLIVPFMQEKIVELWDQDLNELATSAAAEWNFDQPVAAQRFLSLKIDFEDFKNHPLIGYGGRDEESFIQRDALNIVSISGFGKVMAKFGILGVGFFIFVGYISSAYLSRCFHARASALLMVVIVMISLSYSLIEHPLFLCLWAFWLLSLHDSSSVSSTSNVVEYKYSGG